MLRRFSSVLLGLSILGLAACERPAGDALLSGESLTAPRAVEVAIPDTAAVPFDYSNVVLLKGDPSVAEQTLTKIVYKTGKLAIGAHSLNIWERPLDEPMVFTMTVRQTPYLAVDLKAVKLSDGTPVTQFTVPLYLTVSYAKSTTPIPDARQLDVYYVVNGVPQEATVAVVDKKGQKLLARIWHFSEYSPGLGRRARAAQ